MRWSVLVLMTLAACAGSGDQPAPAPAATAGATDGSSGASSTSPSIATSSAPPTQASDGDPETSTQPVGFGSTTATVTAADGTTCEVCLWLADTADERARGLMFVTDLGPADGMAFRYPRPHTGSFWMKNTPLPLSIAFYSPGGEHLGEFDMAPCDSGTCPSFDTPEDFLVAIEVPQGELASLGIGRGSLLELHDIPCA